MSEVWSVLTAVGSALGLWYAQMIITVSRRRRCVAYEPAV